jgi:hypothetical protein
MDNPDSAEAQARAHDRRAYNMPAILEGHEARIRAPEPYRVPREFLAPRAPTPPRALPLPTATTPPITSTSQVTRDPRERNKRYRPEPPTRPEPPAPTPVPSQPPQPFSDGGPPPLYPTPRVSRNQIGSEIQLYDFIHGHKRPASPSAPSEPNPKRRNLQDTPRLRNYFIADPHESEEECSADEEQDFDYKGESCIPLNV